MSIVLCFEVEDRESLRLFVDATNARMGGSENYNVALGGSCFIHELDDSFMLVVLFIPKVPVWIPFKRWFFSWGLKKGLKKKGYKGKVVRLKDQVALWRLNNGSR